MTRSAHLLNDSSFTSTSLEESAGFGVLETDRGGLPLLALDINGRIDGLLAQVNVSQTFVNCLDQPIEATYIFPLPDRAAVTTFRMEVAGRVVEGLLKDRGEARREYDHAITRGHRASIAEEERPNVFTMRVGNLMPGDTAIIKLTLVETLPYSDGEVTFRFPLVVAPRYIPGVPLSGPSVGEGTSVDTSAVPDASRITPPVLLPGFPNPVRLSLVIDLYTARDDLPEPRVSLHSVWDRMENGARRIILKPGARLDRDFVMRFSLGGKNVRTSLSLHPDTDGNEGTFALTVVPPEGVETAGARAVLGRDIIFLLDRSGSMGGWKMVAARRATARMIDTLGEHDRFNVFAFDDRIETFGAGDSGGALGLHPANSHARFRAVEFLRKLESRGGTEIAAPLVRAVDMLAATSADREPILVLVTDGQVGNEDDVLARVAARLLRIRAFTLGIDMAVNEGFLRRLAETGRGGSGSEMVESEERLEQVMDSIHRRIGQPVLTNLRFGALPTGLELIADTITPERPPSLFAGSPLFIMGRYRGRSDGPFELEGDTPGGQHHRELVAPSVRENPAVAAAWAREQVRRLEDRYAAGRGDLSMLEKEIIATSLRFGALCRFTAFVAIDHRTVVNEGGEVHTVIQPVEMPAGWGKEEIIDKLEMSSVFLSMPSASDSLSMPRMRLSAMTRSRARSVPRKAAFPSTPTTDWAGDYTVLDQLAQDQWGTVYRAMGVNRLVTIRKLANLLMLSDKDTVKRLEKKLAALKKSTIIPFIQFVVKPGTEEVVAIVSGEAIGRPILEWIGGRPAEDFLEVAQLMLELAQAIDCAAGKGFAHGHLTPTSILVDDKGTPRVADFALGALLGMPAMSAQNDVASLGAIMYQVLTGREASSIPPRRYKPHVPLELELICLTAMAADPTARYATAKALASALKTWIASPGRPSSRRERFWK
jgi:Ca-activated chloride channel family protein